MNGIPQKNTVGVTDGGFLSQNQMSTSSSTLKESGTQMNEKNNLENNIQITFAQSNGGTLERFKRSCGSYLVALRIWSFTASLTPVALGSCLAFKENGNFNFLIFVVTCLTALSVHAAGNLVNTYFDYVKGVDNKKSDDRTLVDSILSPNDVASMGGICYAMGCLFFLVMVFLSPAKMEHLALIYFGGLSSSFLYTGGLGLKYIALGDIVIFLTFGPVTVLFAYLSQGGSLSLLPLAYAIPLALNTEAILHSNNTRDMETDRAAGIVTFAIMIGKTGSYMLFSFLLFAPYIIFAIIGINFSKYFFLPMLTIFQAFKFEKLFRTDDLGSMPHKIAILNLQMGLLFVLSCAVTPKEYLPGFR